MLSSSQMKALDEITATIICIEEWYSHIGYIAQKCVKFQVKISGKKNYGKICAHLFLNLMCTHSIALVENVTKREDIQQEK